MQQNVVTNPNNRHILFYTHLVFREQLGYFLLHRYNELIYDVYAGYISPNASHHQFSFPLKMEIPFIINYEVSQQIGTF